MADDRIGLRGDRGAVLGAMMLATALIAIDSTIIATAVPSVVRDIGGFHQFPWLFSIYLLAQAVSVPVYGKLNDMFGRKPVILFGIALFLLGSIFCGAAWNIWLLIAFRVVQGLGAGAIQPTAITIVGDLYSVAERAKVQGYVASVWGVSSVVGPTLGGVFSEYVSWRWIFFVNVPLCLLAAWMIMRRFHEDRGRARAVVDYRGATLLTVGLTLLILGVLEGGQAWGWASPASVAILGLGVLLLIAFGFVERTAAQPVLPLWIFRRRLLVTSGQLSVCVGAILMALSSYVPTYAQEVLGAGPLVAGLALAALTLGWPIAASQSGRVYLRFGFRVCALTGTTLVFAGSGLLLLLGRHSSLFEVAGYCTIIGLGMGLTSSPTLIAAQSSVGWAERGVVTANNIFLRSVGSALGVAVFGAVANAVLGSGAVTPAGLTTAVHRIFIGIVIVAGLMVVLAALLPGDAPRQKSPDRQAAPGQDAAAPA
ncbi:EmrB/QacA subfamily drug resistance transporter [Actinoplanes octamycinicus]|uniref:EmrB/QacA subfamily drug resistance transporter n=1 Tax=Actinoplanes octamycinicus TaxID=135948 RepID=A0A7W7H4G8_9ACTN|nr:MFS transporter [Actinoplanes octamycinicus]MBB4743816.1 EmrB/QacA subfamily drug resistance transporter [Actinoplanes octamycinicus]GIE58444.1 MFS transporter [Actinoplanes octamycinicus]